MTRCIVSISASENEPRALTLPVDVYTPDGKVLASGIASPQYPAELTLPPVDGLNRVHVLGTLPNGVVLQEVVELNSDDLQATLNVGEHSPHEWLEWVTPFRELDHLRANGSSAFSPKWRIGQVWMKLWRFEQGRWVVVAMPLIDWTKDRGARLAELDIPNAPHLLQIGGEKVAWRLVSLPPGGPVRVALTRSVNDENDAVEVTVGRTHPMNELVMSYLSRGAMAEAGRLAQAWQVANLMLQHKRDDPISAAAGAYVLLKNRRLEDRRQWIENLVDWFPFLADGAIVSAALALQEGRGSDREIRRQIWTALQRGLPVFGLGINILVETMAAIHQGKQESKTFHRAFLAAQAYARASCNPGAYFSFHGKTPTEPLWRPIFGLERKPLTHRQNEEPVEALFFGRHPEALVSVFYGSTRVKLPRAPVDPELTKKLRKRAEAEAIATDEKDPLRYEVVNAPSPMFRPIKVAGVTVEETSFLGEFATQHQSVEGLSFGIGHITIHNDSNFRRRDLEIRAAELPQSMDRPVKAKPASHVITAFDGSE
jgi:hypothetical protein